MLDVLNLALPFFGLILLGLRDPSGDRTRRALAARPVRRPVDGDTAVLMAALPPAINAFVMARQYDVWVTQASGSVLIGTLMSVVTLTAIMSMVKTQALPLPLFH